MLYHVGVEDVEPNHWIAWVLELPGCYSSARNQMEAIAGAPTRIKAFFDWRAQHRRDPNRALRAMPQIKVVESLRAFPSPENPEYLINAFFADDQRPLSAEEVENALELAEYAHRDLMDVVHQLSLEWLDTSLGIPRFESINDILRHVGGSEWWYFERLGMAFDGDELPINPFARLEKVRANTRARLPELVGDARVVEREGEKWSARKVVRRMLWHERDHTQHIAKLLQQLR